MAHHVFRAKLWEHAPDDPGSWHFVTVPAELAEDIALEGGPRRGFGSIRVEVSIGSTTWRTSLFPDAAAGSFVLPVKKQVRTSEGLHAGVTCEVRLEVAPPVRAEYLAEPTTQAAGRVSPLRKEGPVGKHQAGDRQRQEHRGHLDEVPLHLVHEEPGHEGGNDP